MLKRRARFKKKQREEQNTQLHLEMAKGLVEQFSRLPGFGGRTLVPGCGVGFLVQELRNQGIEAYGCEKRFPQSAANIYHKKLEDIHFPTDYFDTVYCGDTLTRTEDGRTEAFEGTAFLNVGAEYRLDRGLRIGAQLQNILGWVRPDINRRNFFGRMSGYRSEAPAVTLGLSYAL